MEQLALRSGAASEDEARRGRARRGGFTLLETMLALTILAVGLLGMSAMQLQAMDNANRGRHSTQASTIAESRLEQLMRARWTTIPATAWTAPVTEVNAVQSGGTVTEQAYQVSWRITNVTAGLTRSVDVRVDWTEQDGRARSYAISSMRFNHEGL